MISQTVRGREQQTLQTTVIKREQSNLTHNTANTIIGRKHSDLAHNTTNTVVEREHTHRLLGKGSKAT